MVACAQRAFYIKLGQQGRWATQCFLERTLRLGYEGTPWSPPESPNWDAVMEHWQTVLNTSHAVATNHTRQIRSFFEADGTCIFITIANNQLYWCLPDGDVERLEDRTHQRRTIDGWHHCSVGGTELTLDRIAGHLQALGGYRGTICAVNDFPYLPTKASG